MTPNQRTDRLFDKAKQYGMTNAVTGDGMPSRSMVIEAIVDAERDSGQCAEIFLENLDKRIEFHFGPETGNPYEVDNAVVLALINVRDAYKDAFQ